MLKSRNVPMEERVYLNWGTSDLKQTITDRKEKHFQ